MTLQTNGRGSCEKQQSILSIGKHISTLETTPLLFHSGVSQKQIMLMHRKYYKEEMQT